MRRSCNLCGKKALFWQEHLIHGTSCFDLCRTCEKYLKRLSEKDHYETAKKYLEQKMKQGRNERINYILRNRMINCFHEKGYEPEAESGEENETARTVKSIGVLGGGVMFLFGICILNVHVQLAIRIIMISALAGAFVYGTGIAIAVLLGHMEKK